MSFTIIRENPEDARLRQWCVDRIFILRGDALSYKGHGILISGDDADYVKADHQVGNYTDATLIPPDMVLRTEAVTPTYVQPRGNPIFFDTHNWTNGRYFPLELICMVHDGPTQSADGRGKAIMQRQAVERALFSVYLIGDEGFEYSAELAGRVLDLPRIVISSSTTPADLAARIREHFKPKKS